MKTFIILLIGMTTFSWADFRQLPTGEYTVPHTYSNLPCGTLMIQHVEPGSVHLGRGPVYEKALAVCGDINSNHVPDDYSVRTLSCKDRDGQAPAHAVFAFRCTTPDLGDMYRR